MTISTSLIPMVSPFSVDGTIFTTEMYNQFVEWSAAQLAKDAPDTMPGAMSDRCQALLIAHYYAVTKGQTGFRSYTVFDFSATQDAGTTPYLLEYRQIIDDFQDDISDTTSTGEASGSLRCDASMPEFNLDQTDVPQYFMED